MYIFTNSVNSNPTMNRLIRLLFLTILSVFAQLSYAQTTVIIGTGTIKNGSTAYPAPYGNYYEGARHQILILASELTAAGAQPGFITALAFDVSTISDTSHTDFTIKMGNTTATALTTTTPQSGLTTVYTTPSYVDVLGWNTHTFTQNFYWNGTSNIIVETCFNNADFTNKSWSRNAVFNQSTTAYVSTIIRRLDESATVCTADTFTLSNSQRPNIKFTFLPPNGEDVGLTQLITPASPISPSSTTSVTVELGSFASNTISTASVGYKLNNNPAIIENWNGVMGIGQFSTHTFSTQLTFPSSGIQTLKVWATTPNGVYPDLNPGNDTLTKTLCFSMAGGTYTIGGGGANFATILDAITAIQCGGVSGAVIFNVNPGYYTGNFVVANIPGTSATNSVTFRALTAGTVTLSHPAGATNTTIFSVANTPYVKFEKINFVHSIIGTGTNYAIKIDLGSNNNEIKNCTFFDSITTTSSSLRAIGVLKSSQVLISGNNFTGYGTCVYMQGDIANYNLNNQVIQNTFGKFYTVAVDMQYQKNVLVNKNTIANTQVTNSVSAVIRLDGAYEAVISNNRISGNIGSYGISLNNLNTDGVSNNMIFNNEISGSSTSAIINGIYLNATYSAASTPPNPVDRAYIAYNSINLNISSANSSTANGAIQINGPLTIPAFYEVTLYNNSMVIYGSVHIAYRALNLRRSYIIDSLISNYNNFYLMNVPNPVFRVDATDINTLTDWKTVILRDLNSVAIDPAYVAPNNLIPSFGGFNNLGKPIAGITTDNLGVARHATTPDIGAFEFTPLPADVGVQAILAPTTGCGLTSNQTVRIRIRNYGTSAATNFQVAYRVNALAPVTATFTGTLPAGDTVSYSFPVGANLSVPGTYTLRSWSSMTGDSNKLNDSTSTVTVVNIPSISTYPYSENFESGNGGWLPYGTNISWELGTPAKTVINSAATPGSNSYVTKLTGTYNANENSWLQGPCFNLSAMASPKFKMSIWWESERNWDCLALQSSLDGGINWTTVGVMNDPLGVNWYNGNTMSSSTVTSFFGGQKDAWSGRNSTTNGSGSWKTAEMPLVGLGGQSQVLLRIAFGSDGSGNYEGFAVDNFEIVQPIDPIVDSITILKDSCFVGARKVDARIIRFAGLQSVNLHHDLNASGSYTTTVMTKSQILGPNKEMWTAMMPATAKGKKAKYYVIAIDSLGLRDTSDMYEFTSETLTALAGPDKIIVAGDTATIGLPGTISSGLGLVISEVMVNRGGTGTQSTFPIGPATGSADIIEITNTSPAPKPLNGLRVYSVGATTTLTFSYGLPAITLASGEFITLVGGTGTDSPTDKLYYMKNSSSDFTTSGTAVGIYLKDTVANSLIDAVGLNSYVFLPASGVTAADWSGNVTPISGKSGIQRNGSDTNTSADWVINDAANVSTIGILNPGLTVVSLTYSWATLIGLPVGTGAQIKVTPSVTTSYVMTMSDGKCAKTDTVIVFVVGGATDVGVSAFISPTASSTISGHTPLVVRIKNYGIAAVSFIDVTVRANGQPVSTATYIGTVNPTDSVSFTITPSWLPTLSGNIKLCAYTVGVTDDYDRTNDTTCINLLSTVDVKNISNTNGLVKNAYPNPTNGLLNLEVDMAGEAGMIQICDMVGRVMKQVPITAGTSNRLFIIDTQGFASGMYTYRVISGNKFQAATFVVTK